MVLSALFSGEQPLLGAATTNNETVGVCWRSLFFFLVRVLRPSCLQPAAPAPDNLMACVVPVRINDGYVGYVRLRRGRENRSAAVEKRTKWSIICTKKYNQRRWMRIADRGSRILQLPVWDGKARVGACKYNSSHPGTTCFFSGCMYVHFAINFCSILKTNFYFPLEQKTETITRSAAFAPLTLFFLLLLSPLDAMGPVCLFAGERSPEAQPGAGAAHTGPGATRRDHQGRGHRGGRRRVGQPHPDALHRGGRVGDRRGTCGYCFLWLLFTSLEIFKSLHVVIVV